MFTNFEDAGRKYPAKKGKKKERRPDWSQGRGHAVAFLQF